MNHMYEREMMRNVITDSNRAIVDLINENAGLKEENTELKESNNHYMKIAQELRDESDSKSKNRDAMLHKIAELKTENSNLRFEIDAKNQRIRELEDYRNSTDIDEEKQEVYLVFINGGIEKIYKNYAEAFEYVKGENNTAYTAYGCASMTPYTLD